MMLNWCRVMLSKAYYHNNLDMCWVDSDARSKCESCQISILEWVVMYHDLTWQDHAISTLLWSCAVHFPYQLTSSIKIVHGSTRQPCVIISMLEIHLASYCKVIDGYMLLAHPLIVYMLLGVRYAATQMQPIKLLKLMWMLCCVRWSNKLWTLYDLNS